jgi:hypothetical protein
MSKQLSHQSQRNGIIAVILFYATATLVARRLGYRFGRNTVVRCRHHHLYTTFWVPGASVKAVRLGWARWQHCPVGRHWSLITPVRDSDLTDNEGQYAHQHHDIPIP